MRPALPKRDSECTQFTQRVPTVALPPLPATPLPRVARNYGLTRRNGSAAHGGAPGLPRGTGVRIEPFR